MLLPHEFVVGFVGAYLAAGLVMSARIMTVWLRLARGPVYGWARFFAIYGIMVVLWFPYLLFLFALLFLTKGQRTE